MNPDHLALLKVELDLIGRAAKTLQYSLKRCMALGKKQEYSLEEQERFESLTARFARLSDILVQKIFRLVDTLDLEDQGTVLDRINRAEKKGLIQSARTFIEIRELRNRVAHEYMPESVTQVFHEVMEKAPYLLDSVARVKQHTKKYFV